MFSEENAVQAPIAGSLVVNSELQERRWPQNLLGIALVLALCYYAQEVLVVVMISVLAAFTLAPLVDWLGRMRVPRALASAVALLIVCAGLIALISYSYNQAAAMASELPRHTAHMRDDMARITRNSEALQLLTVGQATNWPELLSRAFGPASRIIFAGSFVPLLVYFMLSWQDHVRASTVMLFPLKDRNTAYVALGLIAAMIRSFMVGNLIIALFMGAVSTAVFGLLHIPFFYLVGFASGFLSLFPYLGVLLALAPPIFVGIGHLGPGTLLGIVVTVVGLHIVTMNVLYPKFLGNRLQLNPLAVTISLLVWTCLWGGAGLLLAIPITAAMKIVFDHVESLKAFGMWLGE